MRDRLRAYGGGTVNPPARILVVEDDDKISLLAQLLLRREGWEVDAAADGAEALRKIRAGNYAVIVLDLMLPVVNGFEVLQELSALRRGMLARVIVLTAASEATLAHFDRTSVAEVIRKPFDIRTFVGAVRRCARAAASSRRGRSAWPREGGREGRAGIDQRRRDARDADEALRTRRSLDRRCAHRDGARRARRQVIGAAKVDAIGVDARSRRSCAA